MFDSIEDQNDSDYIGYTVIDVAENMTDAPAEVPETILGFEAMQALVYEFTNFTSTGFHTDDAFARLDVLEQHLLRSIPTFETKVQKEQLELRRLTSLASKVREIKSKWIEFQSQLNSLGNGW